MSMPDLPALSLRALTKRYDGGLLALDGFDLDIPDGEFFGPRTLIYLERLEGLLAALRVA